jgi:hypothetical protein
MQVDEEDEKKVEDAISGPPFKPFILPENRRKALPAMVPKDKINFPIW